MNEVNYNQYISFRDAHAARFSSNNFPNAPVEYAIGYMPFRLSVRTIQWTLSK